MPPCPSNAPPSGQVLAGAYTLVVLVLVLEGGVLGSDVSHWSLVWWMVPWVFVCLLIRPEQRSGNVLVTAAFTYCVLIFISPLEASELVRRSSPRVPHLAPCNPTHAPPRALRRGGGRSFCAYSWSIALTAPA